MYQFCRYKKEDCEEIKWIVNPVRCVEAILCLGCFALAIYFIADYLFMYIAFKVILALTAAAFASITIIDVISTTHNDPIFWNVWILFAMSGGIAFAICAGVLMSTGTGFSLILVVGEVVFGVTAIVFLLDAFFGLCMMRQKSVKVEPDSKKKSEKEESMPEKEEPLTEKEETEPLSSSTPISEVPSGESRRLGKKRGSGEPLATSYGGTFAVSKDVAPLPSPAGLMQSSVSIIDRKKITSRSQIQKISVGSDGKPYLEDGTLLNPVRDAAGNVFYRTASGFTFNSEGVPVCPGQLEIGPCPPPICPPVKSSSSMPPSGPPSDRRRSSNRDTSRDQPRDRTRERVCPKAPCSPCAPCGQKPPAPGVPGDKSESREEVLIKTSSCAMPKVSSARDTPKECGSKGQLAEETAVTPTNETQVPSRTPSSQSGGRTVAQVHIERRVYNQGGVAIQSIRSTESVGDNVKTTSRTVAISTRMIPKICVGIPKICGGKPKSAPGAPEPLKDNQKRSIKSAAETEQSNKKSSVVYPYQTPQPMIYQQYYQHPCGCGHAHYQTASTVPGAVGTCPFYLQQQAEHPAGAVALPAPVPSPQEKSPAKDERTGQKTDEKIRDPLFLKTEIPRLREPCKCIPKHLKSTTPPTTPRQEGRSTKRSLREEIQDKPGCGEGVSKHTTSKCGSREEPPPKMECYIQSQPLQTISECEGETESSTWGARTISEVSSSQLTSTTAEDSCGCYVCGAVDCKIHGKVGQQKYQRQQQHQTTSTPEVQKNNDEVQTSETRMIRAQDLEAIKKPNLPGSADDK